MRISDWSSDVCCSDLLLGKTSSTLCRCFCGTWGDLGAVGYQPARQREASETKAGNELGAQSTRANRHSVLTGCKCRISVLPVLTCIERAALRVKKSHDFRSTGSGMSIGPRSGGVTCHHPRARPDTRVPHAPYPPPSPHPRAR